MKDIAVLIVNWNTKEYLKKCLVSIITNCKQDNYDIFVIDNNSYDGSLEMIKSEFKKVNLIENKENVGYGKALNQGIKIVKSKYLLILNSDVELKKDIMSVFLNFMEVNKNIGVVGPKLLNSDGTIQVSYNIFFPGIFSFFFNRILFLYFMKLKLRKNKVFLKLFYSSHKTRQVKWIGGSCMFIRKSAIEKTGYFDENFFMYGEETELCLRMKKAGYLVYYLPKVQIIHHEAQSSIKNFDKVFIEMYKSDIYFIQKYYNQIIVDLAKIFILIGLYIKSKQTRTNLCLKTISILRLKEPLLKMYFIFRLPFIFLVRFCFKPRKKLEKVEKIIIFRLDRMGDFVLTIPVIDNLKLEYPAAKITVVVRSYLKELTTLVKNIDDTIIDEGIISIIKKIREQKYDIALDMLYDYKLKSAVLTFLTGAPVRIGFSGGKREYLFNLMVKESEFFNKSMREINLEILKKLNVPIKINIPRINIKEKNTVIKTCISVHPGGYYPSQRWDTDKTVDLLKEILVLYKVDIKVIGGINDQKLVESIIANVKDEKVQAVYSSIKELVNILSESKLLICNNSGPLHLASALGIPTISTMGPTDPVLWWPYGDKNTVIRKNLDCSPCSLGKCATNECMHLITVEEMFDAVKKVLDGNQ
ncbi:MAG: glycosyltransferase family 9 protein [Candidatus Firestonebacteria bacterium]